MSNTGEEEFKEMLNKLRQTTKMPELVRELRYENKLLETELQQCKNDNALLQCDIINHVKRYTELRFNIEKFMKEEAISFMRVFKGISKDEEFTEEIQALINHFIFKLTHSVYLSSKK